MKKCILCFYIAAVLFLSGCSTKTFNNVFNSVSPDNKTQGITSTGAKMSPASTVANTATPGHILKSFTVSSAQVLADRINNELISLAATGADENSLARADSILKEFGNFSKDGTPLYLYMESLKNAFASVAGYAGGTSLENDLAGKYNKLLSDGTELKVTAFNKVPEDRNIWFQAAAACYERGLRKPGEYILTAVGDCSFGTYPEARPGKNFDKIYEKNGSNKNYVFKNCLAWFNSDTFTLINNECAMTNATEHEIKPWPLKSKPEHISILPANGIEGANLANNHTSDYFEIGYRDTLKAFSRAGVDVYNDGMPLIRKTGNIETVFLGYDCRVRLQNKQFLNRILNDIKKYKTPDRLLIVSMHWGPEYREIPVDYQVKFGHYIIDAGADLILGCHPHILQGVEMYKGKYIIYSMGDFAFGGDPDLESRVTCMFRLTISNRNSSPTVTGLRIVPCFENSDGSLTDNNYQPLPLTGKEAAEVTEHLKKISSRIKGGLTNFEYFDPFK